MTRNRTSIRHDRQGRAPLAHVRDLAPPIELTEDERADLDDATARKDRKRIDEIIAGARKRLHGEVVALDSAETARLVEVARAFYAAPWDATPPSDADVAKMRSEIARIDGAENGYRNPLPKYAAGVYLGAVERDARKRADAARHDAMPDLVRVHGHLYRRELVEAEVAKWDGLKSDSQASGSRTSDEQSAARHMATRIEQASGMSRTEPPKSETEE